MRQVQTAQGSHSSLQNHTRRALVYQSDTISKGLRDANFDRVGPGKAGPTPHDDLLRLLDIVLASLLIVGLAPILLLVSLAVWLQDRGAPLFTHRRIGYGGAPFGCLKFRTMAADADARLAAILADNPLAAAEWARDHKLRRDPRVTPIGVFLRESSLDELPQLFNVLMGQMSLVGPRPIVHAEIAKYGRYFRYYCSVKPGITGLWQVSGRNDASYRRRVALDVIYVRRRSTPLNLNILIRTIPAVLLKRGSY